MDECQSCTGVRGFGYCSDENLEYWNINGQIVNDGGYTLASYPGSWWVGLGMCIYTKLKRPDVINYHKKMAEIYTHDFMQKLNIRPLTRDSITTTAGTSISTFTTFLPSQRSLHTSG